MLARQVPYLGVGLLLAQDPEELFYREPLQLRHPSPSSEPGSKYIWRISSVVGRQLSRRSEQYAVHQTGSSPQGDDEERLPFLGPKTRNTAAPPGATDRSS